MRFCSLLPLAVAFVPSALAAVTRRQTATNFSPAPSSLNFGTRGASLNTTRPTGQHPLHGDSPSFNLWTAREKSDFIKAVSSFPDPVSTKACPVYADQTITISVYYRIHYYSNSSGSKNRSHGYISPAQVKANLAQLNKDYSTSKPRIKFVLGTGTGKLGAGIHYIVFNRIAAWNSFVIAPPSNQAELDAIDRIAVNARGPLASRPADKARQLFIYTVKAIQYNAIAFAFFPQSTYPFSVDGVYFSQEYFEKPKTDMDYYYPHTSAHEVGHWLTLQHTFEGGCDAPNTLSGGDMVTDTPTWEDTSDFNSISCVAYKDWGYNYTNLVSPCGAQSKGDIQKNIRNYMSYSLPLCENSFTPGQYKRAWSAAINFRKFVPVCGTVA